MTVLILLHAAHGAVEVLELRGHCSRPAFLQSLPQHLLIHLGWVGIVGAEPREFLLNPLVDHLWRGFDRLRHWLCNNLINDMRRLDGNSQACKFATPLCRRWRFRHISDGRHLLIPLLGGRPHRGWWWWWHDMSRRAAGRSNRCRRRRWWDCVDKP